MKFIPRWLLILLGFPVATHAQVTIITDQQNREQIVIDGNIRAFETYIPKTSGTEKLPVVISLHGGFASPKGQFRLADFRPLADKDKFIVVCPASKHIWHDGADTHGIDDVKFIDQLITYILNKYHGDASRVYVTGISNGGFMTTRLACQLNKRIAAVAVVAASLDEGEGYAPVRPRAVNYMHGTKDPVISNKGGKAFGRAIYSQEQVLKVWVGVDKCDPKPVVTNLPDT